MPLRQIADIKIHIDRKLKDINKYDHLLPFFSFFYSKEEHFNLTRLAILFVSFIALVAVQYLFEFIPTVSTILTAITITAVVYFISVYLISRKHEIIKHEIKALKERKEQIEKELLRAKSTEELENKLLKLSKKR